MEETTVTTSASRSMKSEEKKEDDAYSTYIAYTPINYLNTFLYDWKIQARVTKKHDLKTWKKGSHEGCLFNIDLIDEKGT